MLVAAAMLCATVALQAPSPAPSPSASPSGPIVLMQTSLGDIKIRLDREKAPISVDNFLGYVKTHHYDGTIFHRVIPNFMAQGGGMDVAMKPRPTKPPIKNEGQNGLKNLRGTLAMARTNDPDSATDQFFINVKDNAFLDPSPRNPAGYAVFGEVVEGMDVVDKIVTTPTTAKGPHENLPQTPVVIKSARLLTPMPAAKPAARPAGAAAARPRPRPRPSASPHH
jgi:peptidyl-prolyl cis-trans isomerase A (cyclophilin A)